MRADLIESRWDISSDLIVIPWDISSDQV